MELKKTNKSMPSVHMLIKTNGMAYDDRLRKECLSVQKIGCELSVSAIENSNENRFSYSYKDGDELNARCFSLMTRKMFKHKSFSMIYLLEFLIRAIGNIIKQKPDVVWLHDPVLVIFLPILVLLRATGVVGRIIWDQHELPIKKIDSSPLLRKVFGFFCRRVDVLIEANQQRLNYLRDNYNAPDPNKGAVIQNYSDSEFAEQPLKNLPNYIKAWLKGREYLLVQSGAVRFRQFPTVVEAILTEQQHPPIIVVGGGDDKLISSLKKKFGQIFDDKIFVIGKVPQMELTRYLDNAIASIILYQKNFGINNWLCEPNRLYQAVCRRKPVLVGNNPPMSEVVKEYNLGVVLDDDGESVKKLQNGLHCLFKELDSYSTIFSSLAIQFSWESQESKIRDLLS